MKDLKTAVVPVLVEALYRIAAASPASTNSNDAKSMASWTRAVALTALEDTEGREATAPAPQAALGSSADADTHRGSDGPVVGWQPIETAPKDGTELFVWGCVESSPYSRPHMGCDDIERVRWDGHGWFVTSAQADSIWVPEPTHWMPLPAAPEAGQ